MFEWSRRKRVTAPKPVEPHTPFLLNVPGPFYTCGNCLACGLPEDEAPELLAPLESESYAPTHFVRQPETAEEVEHACMAIDVCCVSDLRYGGQDPAIIQRLGNNPRKCDFVIREDQVAVAEPDDE